MPTSGSSPHGNVQNISSFRSLFSIPAPVKALFDAFPAVTYAPNALPQRTPKPTNLPTLYVFSTPEDAAAGRPSFNPTCLKWQTFLRIAGVRHILTSSNNHASPTGTLPFLLPAIHAPQSTPETPLPISASKLTKYAFEHGSNIKEPTCPRYEAYQSLLDYRIRNAWLYHLYLSPLNASLAEALYITPSSSSLFVRATLAHQLRSAAESELLKSSSKIDAQSLYHEAKKAFEALSVVLGEDDWFFGSEEPTLFDAGVFAYTHLLLDEDLGWRDDKLGSSVRERGNLVRHRERILTRFWNR